VCVYARARSCLCLCVCMCMCECVCVRVYYDSPRGRGIIPHERFVINMYTHRPPRFSIMAPCVLQCVVQCVAVGVLQYAFCIVCFCVLQCVVQCFALCVAVFVAQCSLCLLTFTRIVLHVSASWLPARCSVQCSALQSLLC